MANNNTSTNKGSVTLKLIRRQPSVKHIYKIIPPTDNRWIQRSFIVNPQFLSFSKVQISSAQCSPHWRPRSARIRQLVPPHIPNQLHVYPARKAQHCCQHRRSYCGQSFILCMVADLQFWAQIWLCLDIRVWCGWVFSNSSILRFQGKNKNISHIYRPLWEFAGRCTFLWATTLCILVSEFAPCAFGAFKNKGCSGRWTETQN